VKHHRERLLVQQMQVYEYKSRMVLGGRFSTVKGGGERFIHLD
jgi:hypothetical protein